MSRFLKVIVVIVLATSAVGLAQTSKYAARRTSNSSSAKGGTATPRAIRLGLEWLQNHQDEDGGWDADGFMKHDEEPTDGAGNPVHDVGVTALALLAFLGDGNTPSTGPYQDVVEKGVAWLSDQQGDDGMFGARSYSYIYDHALAALAVVEAYGLSGSESLKQPAQAGIQYLESHRNPGMVWRYHARDGQNDSSVTSWAIMAYISARDFGLEINPAALEDAAAWFDSVTNEEGQVGYTRRGEPSSRHPEDRSSRFPPEKGEALTAAGLMCRFFLGQDPNENPIMTRAADTILAKPPEWDENAGTIDHYYWYYGTYALYQMGGRHWNDWSRRLTHAVIETQRGDGPFEGSWDPVGVWGEDGGRVYSTAILVLTLEAYYRYTRVFLR